jgi:hypothetical protein
MLCSSVLTEWETNKCLPPRNRHVVRGSQHSNIRMFSSFPQTHPSSSDTKHPDSRGGVASHGRNIPLTIEAREPCRNCNVWPRTAKLVPMSTSITFIWLIWRAVTTPLEPEVQQQFQFDKPRAPHAYIKRRICTARIHDQFCSETSFSPPPTEKKHFHRLDLSVSEAIDDQCASRRAPPAALIFPRHQPDIFRHGRGGCHF